MLYKFEPIKRQKLFDFLFQNGKRFSEGALRAVVYPSDVKVQSTKFTIFYAVYVPKKQVRKAVVRNRIKRLLRVALRKVATDDYPDSFWIVKYVWLGWNSAPNRPCEISLGDVYPSVKNVMSQALNFFLINHTLDRK